ncbi:MAG: helix-turn-helix domain-containing protein [Candidatus Avelusimicrobium sp.]|uniref:helix-turn-helix domain-containing protein n=1 Tax=Candidatus Avelusimicrobium sp. TaxID=3048833 RepID=UPI003F00426F
MDITHKLAKHIRLERLKRRLSQAELAEKADLHPNYIGLIERAKCNISIVTLDKLAKALGVNICNLI